MSIRLRGTLVSDLASSKPGIAFLMMLGHRGPGQWAFGNTPISYKPNLGADPEGDYMRSKGGGNLVEPAEATEALTS